MLKFNTKLSYVLCWFNECSSYIMTSNYSKLKWNIILIDISASAFKVYKENKKISDIKKKLYILSTQIFVLIIRKSKIFL